MMKLLKEKMSIAESFEAENKYLHALQIYKSLSEEIEYKSITCIKLIQLYDKMGQLQHAFQYGFDYLKKYSDDSRVRKYFVQFLIKKEEYKKAIELSDSMDLEKFPAFHMLIGLAHYYLGDNKLAIINFENYLNSSETELRAEAYFYIGSSLNKLKEFDKSLKILDKSEKLFSMNPELHVVKAINYYYKQMFVHAFEALQKAEALEKNNLLVKEWKGKVLYELGEFDKVELYLNDLIKSGEPSVDDYSLLGYVKLKKNNITEAKSFFMKALELNPDDSAARKGLSQSEKLTNKK